MEYFWASVKDWKTWLYAAIYMGGSSPSPLSPLPPPDHTMDTDIWISADAPLYAFSLFLPSIIASLGYKATTAQLLTVPPYAAAAIFTITVGCGFKSDTNVKESYNY